MDTKVLTTSYTQLLKTSVDVFGKQHNAISQNIANANNDNYRRVTTDFSSELKTAVDNTGVKTTREKHIKQGHYAEASNPAVEPSAKEQVDLAREMTDLSVNQIRHEFATRALARHYAGISKAIAGRNQ